MIVYFDTSALVKRYLVEADSPTLEALWNKTTRVVASEILYDEMAATFARKKREVPADAASIEEARGLFCSEWLSMRRVAVNDTVHQRVDELLMSYALRGADAIHGLRLGRARCSRAAHHLCLCGREARGCGSCRGARHRAVASRGHINDC